MFPRFRFIPPASSSATRESLRVLGITDVVGPTTTGKSPARTHLFRSGPVIDTSNKRDLGGADRVRTRSGRVVLSVPNPETPQSLRLQDGFASKDAFDTPATKDSATCGVPESVASDSGHLGKLLAPDGYAKFVQIVLAYGGSVTKLGVDSFASDPMDSYVVAVDRCCAEHASSFGAQIPPVFALTMPTKTEGIHAVQQAWVDLLTSWSADWTVRRVRTRSQVGARTLAAARGAAPSMYGSMRAGFPFAATAFTAGGVMLSLVLGIRGRRAGALTAGATASLVAPALITRDGRSLYESVMLKRSWRRARAKGHSRYSDSARQAFKR